LAEGVGGQKGLYWKGELRTVGGGRVGSEKGFVKTMWSEQRKKDRKKRRWAKKTPNWGGGGSNTYRAEKVTKKIVHRGKKTGPKQKKAKGGEGQSGGGQWASALGV